MKKYFFLFRKKERLFFSFDRSFNRSFNCLFVQSIIQVYKQFFLLFFLLLALLTQKSRTNYRYRFYYRRNQYNTVFFSLLSSFLSLLSLVSYIALVSDLIQNNNEATNNILFLSSVFFPFCFRDLNFPTSFPRRLRRPCLRRFYRPPYSRLLTTKLKTNKTTLKTVPLNYYKDRQQKEKKNKKATRTI